MQETAARLLLGNSYSTPVRQEVAYTVIKVSEGVRVYAQVAATTTMVNGQQRRQDLDSNELFNGLQSALEQVRDSFN